VSLSPQPYHIKDTSKIFSPALVLFKDRLEANLDHLIQVAGSASRLRPLQDAQDSPGNEDRARQGDHQA
jgi:hypothetical protein